LSTTTFSVRPRPEKLPPAAWNRFEERFERLLLSDQHLVLASIELAPDTPRSAALVPAFSRAGNEFMRDFANAEAARYAAKVARADG
jgi:hypothetical protein